MKSTEKFERKINKLLADNDVAKANIRAKMAKAEADKAEGQKELNAAAEMNDDAAYHAAKEKVRFATDTIEMCAKRLDALNSSVCSREEYEETLNAIQDSSIKAEQAAQKKAASLIAELCKLADELDTTIDKNNALCSKWCSAANENNTFGHYFNKNTSEVLYLRRVFHQRKNATQSLLCNQDNDYSIYELIND